MSSILGSWKVGVFVAVFLWAAFSVAVAAETSEEAGAGSLELTPETRELLRAEMREITRAMASLIPAVAEGRWDDVAETGKQISASFLLKQEMTAAQREELAEVLPPRFKQLDGKFHKDAEKLSEAAGQQDAELVTFRFYQLMSGCIGCHAQFARPAFPGFTAIERPH